MVAKGHMCELDLILADEDPRPPRAARPGEQQARHADHRPAGQIRSPTTPPPPAPAQTAGCPEIRVPSQGFAHGSCVHVSVSGVKTSAFAASDFVPSMIRRITAQAISKVPTHPEEKPHSSSFGTGVRRRGDRPFKHAATGPAQGAGRQGSSACRRRP